MSNQMRSPAYVRVARPFGLVVALSIAPASPAAAQGVRAPLAQFLHDKVGLNGSQLAALDRGEVVVKALDTGDKRDVAVFGIVAVDASRDAFTRQMLDVAAFVRRPTQTGLGLFSTPPAATDMASFTLDRKDLANLRTCRPRDCHFKLPGAEMLRFQQAIDWSGADPGAQADEYVRQRMVEYVGAYRAGGDSAMVVYEEHATVRASDAFAALLRQSPYVYENNPELHAYLSRYPAETLDGAHEEFFWAVDVLKGLQPIFTANHWVVYAPPGASYTLSAQKQIYANHYFEAGFNLVAVVDRAGADGRPGVYLIRLDRSRFDNMPSIPLINLRDSVVGKFRDQMKSDLERQKAAAEAATP